MATTDPIGAPTRTLPTLHSALLDGDAAAADPSLRAQQASTDVETLVSEYCAKLVAQYARHLAAGRFDEANELAFEAMAFDQDVPGPRLMDELRAIGRTNAFGVAA